tara:strand:- start:410 stop:661 length:252 start_codon:yes stop_codon:yes gene_type:complete
MTLASGVETEVPYVNLKVYYMGVNGGDVTVTRWSASKGAKVPLFNGPVLSGEEVEIETNTSSGKLYMTADAANTYVDFYQKNP